MDYQHPNEVYRQYLPAPWRQFKEGFFWGFFPLSFSIENTGFINSYQPLTSRKNFTHGQQNLQTGFAQYPGSTQHSFRQVCPSTAGSPGDRELHSFHQALRNLPGFHCQCREQCHCCVRLHNVAISSKVHQYYPEQHSHSLSTPSSFWDIELDGLSGSSGWNKWSLWDHWGTGTVNSAVLFISLHQMMDTASSHFGDCGERFQFKFVFSLAPYESWAHTLLCVSLNYFWTLLAYVFPE